MIKVICLRCRCELDAPGGILFSPPQGGSWVSKHHLCGKCYSAVLYLINLTPANAIKDE